MSIVTAIQQATIAYFGIALEELLGPSRGPNVIAAKHIARYLERKAGRSFQEIGTIYSTHHTNVMSSVNHVAERLRGEDEYYTRPVTEIESAVRVARAQDKADVFDAMSCPTCGAPVIQELRRQMALLQERVKELGGLK